jgi:tRNA nucleotidyltransferase/poly(A) polymerase
VPAALPTTAPASAPGSALDSAASTGLRRGRAAATPHSLPAATLGIRQGAIHPHVLHICATLHRQGHKALIVGGAVRDLILGRQPKDFDIVTSAKPEQVKRTFRNARIIGRRFRLCLLRFGEMKVEVSTFRGLPRRGANGMISRDNTYGTPREDAFRRDFTCNALTLDPLAMTIIDHVGGLADLQARRIRTIAAPDVSFAEDPVRMLRALRFQVRLGFSLDPAAAEAIGRLSGTLRQVARHRLADELQRYLTCGVARATFAEFERMGLLRPLLGLEDFGWFFAAAALAEPLPALGALLDALDRWVEEGAETLPPTVVLLALTATLARPEFRATLGAVAPAPDAKLLARIQRELPLLLSEWALLRGQVEPALHILAAARQLLAPQLLARQAEPAEAGRMPMPGEREAWLLLGVVGGLLGADGEAVRQGLARIHELPDLPILDHPRPARRGAAPMERLGFRQSDPLVETESPPSGTGRKRRRRRGSRRGRPQAT